MSPKQTADPRAYANFEEFQNAHPNPARTVRDEADDRDQLFGHTLAREFLQELSGALNQSGADVA